MRNIIKAMINIAVFVHFLSIEKYSKIVLNFAKMLITLVWAMVIDPFSQKVTFLGVSKRLYKRLCLLVG
jgi:hypothetical protein